MTCLSANLSALEAVLGSRVTLPEDDGRVRVDRAGAVPVLHLATASGGSLALNSRRDPVAEALARLEPALAGRPVPAVVVAVGLGLGFVIDAIERRCPGARILAVEPEPACVRPLLERRDLTRLISGGQLFFLWGPDYRGAGEGWRLLGGGEERATVVHPVLSRQDPEGFAVAAKVVERMVFGARSNAEARRKLAGRYLLNTLRNLPVIARSGDVGSLFGAFTGVPGIIISAGPSLDRNIEDLRDVADDAVLIAADTALRPLLSAGIQPQLVVAVDPSEANGQHLRDLPPADRTHIVAEGSIEPAAFEEFGERVFTFKVSDHQPWPWFREHGLDRATLRAWGSVATSAFDLAVKIGCDPIVFAGQDLAFTGGQPYCRGTTFEFDWADLVARGATLGEIWSDWLSRQSLATVTDIHGRSTQTTPTLVAFRDWLAEQCARQGDRRFINATGAGILMGHGLRQASLEMAMPRHARVDDVRAVLQAAGTRRGTADEADALVQQMRADLPASVVETWKEFAGEALRLHDIHAALHIPSAGGDSGDQGGAVVHLSRRGLAAMKQLGGLAPRCALPASALRRQRVTALSAASTPAQEDPVGEARPPAPESAAHLLHSATEALGRLLALEEVASGLLPGFPGVGPSPSASVSLTAPFDWAPKARADVDRLERLVRESSRVARAAPASEPDETERLRWTVAPSTQPQPESAPDANLPISLEAVRWWARRALVIEWATLLKNLAGGDEAGIPGVSQHLAEWIRDLADGPFPVALDQQSTVLTARLVGANGEALCLQFDLRTPPWRLMRALTGAVAPVPAHPCGHDDRAPAAIVDVTVGCRGDDLQHLSCSLEAREAALPATRDPRTRFLAARHGWILPAPLDVPASYRVGILDHRTALVTPFMANHSIAFDEGGKTERLGDWPRALVGEARGRGGTSVAWSGNLAWYLMRRRGEAGDVEVAVPPFRPSRALVLDDGTSYWGAQTGGLWRWAVSGELTCVAATPPVGGLCLTKRGLRLDPNPVDPSSRWQRTAIDVGWVWRFDTEKLESFELPAEGPMWKIAESGDTWAAAYPAADLIRVGGRHGATFDIACEWPVDLAWAGGSLLAATGQGRVLLFQDLVRRLS